MTVKVVTDSTSYIPKEQLIEYDIAVVSLSVLFGEEAYKENEISNYDFYQRLAGVKKIPTSSQPSVDDLYTVFLEQIKMGNEIVAVFISSKMSGTYSTAEMVKKMVIEDYPDAKISIIDSTSNSMQLGYAVLAAAKAAKAGKSIEEVVVEAEKNIKRSKFIFIPDTLEYLRIGGRIGTASALLGSLLQIKPILTVIDGSTAVLGKIRTKKGAMEEMLQIFMKDIERYGIGEAIVHHINIEEEAKEFATMIKEKIKQEVGIVSIGPVIGTHVGPGAIGIAYYTKEAMNN